ncbi:tRNA pseudouridine(55) synthase TruB [Paenibacillus thalictri]|uniref:tRNA pseudouridine synthase B n=1 Tax=Paenibacillus thalictri TaxID=2527873 RepID=A0A4Q9DNV3_9BACL|nr:tRNA pseudouridine(55) synthase TruB [Paenibacillus thalictri]TBL77774.1 tRNA pseudouridine(55) synthase TruB [Paenibacillus thalictri]
MTTNTITPLEGILPVMKPAGWTSHDVVAKVRRILKEKRIGHTGTLDPQVTGVLPLCIGRATRMVEYIQELPKEYEATLTVGYATDTEDASGNITERVDSAVLTLDQVEAVLRQFVGEIEQVPPMFSAIKVDGKRLYELAREGKEVERKSRKVTLYQIELISADLDKPHPDIRFRALCSKGTYIRTLCVDIGKELGYPAVMSHLTRTRTGNIGLSQCITLEELEARRDNGTVPELLIPVDAAVLHLNKTTLNETQTRQALQGQKIRLSQSSDVDERLRALYRVYSSQNDFIGVFEWDPELGCLAPVKVFS